MCPPARWKTSLNAVARQSSAQILFASDITAGKSAPALRGRYTLQQALQRLLGKSGLTAQERDEHTYLVLPPLLRLLKKRPPAIRLQWNWPAWRSARRA